MLLILCQSIINDKIVIEMSDIMNQIKLKRIASQIVREVSDILNNVARDRMMHTVTITGCDVSSDLSYAKIYFTCVLDIEKKDIEKELEEASGYVRKELADRIELRHIPKLVFKFDESVEYGNHIENILDKIHEKDGGNV